MGQRDLYPFVLNKDVMGKMEFIHDLIVSARNVPIDAAMAA